MCLAGTIVLKVVPKSNIGGSLAALYIVYMYWAPYMVFGQLLMYANVGGTSKKVAVFTISYLGETHSSSDLFNANVLQGTVSVIWLALSPSSREKHRATPQRTLLCWQVTASQSG